jgi:hypothetical protein
MILMRILPGVLKELARNVPAVLFQTVEWSELAAELPQLSRRMLQREGYQELLASHRSLLEADHIVPHAAPLAAGPGKINHNHWFAEKVLRLFFIQLFSPQGLFLDLRSQNFSCDHPKLNWHPTTLWTKFSPEFQQGLLDVYDGFYFDETEKFKSGLERIGLLSPTWPAQDQERLCQLFRAQFGASHDEVHFDLDHFRAAIMKLADFLLKKKVSINKDFLYLGINLVTLYATLEETHEKLPVREIYAEVRQRFKGPLAQA